MFLLGLSWLLASLGVYLRDIAQVAGVLATALMFLSPVFYPLGALPSQFRSIAALNPLTLIIEETRKVLGISDGLVRLSVGLEAVDDLWKDLEHALG